jgi:hypothetical protein
MSMRVRPQPMQNSSPGGMWQICLQGDSTIDLKG